MRSIRLLAELCWLTKAGEVYIQLKALICPRHRVFPFLRAIHVTTELLDYSSQGV